MAGRNFRRGKGNGSGDKTTEDTEIKNSVSASDGRSEDVPVPPPPRPVQKRQGGRTDLNAQQGSQLHQQLYSDASPKITRREQQKIDEMKNASAAPVATATTAAVPAMGMGATAALASDYVSPTDDQMRDLARQSIADMNDKRDPADTNWMSEADTDRFYATIGRVEDAQKIADHLSLEETNRLSVEGHIIERDGVTYRGQDGRIVSTMGPTEGTPLSNASVFDVQAEITHREAINAQKEHEPLSQSQSIHGPDQHAVFFTMGDTRIQFSDGTPTENAAEDHLYDLRHDLILSGQEAIAERLHVDVQTPEERAIETTQALDAPRHAAAYRELTGEEFPSSTPMQVEDQKSIVDAYETASAVARQPDVRSAADRPQTPEAKQTSADQMFAQGKDLREIHAHTGTKPEGAEQTAWEKTEFVYGQPTALDRLQEMGKGSHAVSETGYTYAMSADGKELIRFDADLKEAGRKSVEDVQAYLHEKRGVEFDKLQEQKQEAQKQAVEASAQEKSEVEAEQTNEVVEEAQPEAHHEYAVEDLPTNEEALWSQAEYAEKQEGYYQEQKDAEEVAYQQQETWDQSKEYAEAAVADMSQSAAQPMSESQLETAALLRGDQVEAQQEQAGEAVPKQAEQKLEVQQEVAAELTTEAQAEAEVEPSSEVQHEQQPKVEADMQSEAPSAFQQFSAEQDAKEAKQAPVVEKEAPREIAQQGVAKEMAEDKAQQLSNAPGEGTSEQFAKELTEPQKEVDVKGGDKAGPEIEEKNADKGDDANFAMVEHETVDLKASADPSFQQEAPKKQEQPEIEGAKNAAQQGDGSSPTFSSSNSKAVEEDKIHDVEQKLEIQQAPSSGEKKEPSAFEKFSAERNTKEAQQAAPSVDQQPSVDAPVKPEVQQQAEPQQSADVANKSSFEAFAAQQDQKEVAQAQQPQQESEEERRRGTGLEAA